MWANFWESYLWTNYLFKSVFLQLQGQITEELHTHIRTSTHGWKMHSQSSTDSFKLTCTHHFLLLSCPWYKILAPYYNLWTTNKAQSQDENNCRNINNDDDDDDDNNNNNALCAILLCSWPWSILIYTGYEYSFIPVSTSTITT